jgi:peptidoglycan/xylan/chitin deacetylase (PgdA/CDA1 family)
MTDARKSWLMLLGACSLSVVLIVGYVLAHPVPVVLMFHSIAGDPDDDSPHVTAARFQALLETIRQRNMPVEITTDSSDSSIYTDFASDLRARGFTATIFLIPLALAEADALTWEQIRELDRAGFTIGSHTLTHPWLPDLTDEEVTCELCASKTLIERELGHAVTALSYPYGAFDARIQRIAKQCGYTRAYTTAPGRRIPDDDSLAHKRVYANETLVKNPALTWLALSGYYVTTRELVLSILPIDIPRKPEGWSYSAWQTSEKWTNNQTPFCSAAAQPTHTSS